MKRLVLFAFIPLFTWTLCQNSSTARTKPETAVSIRAYGVKINVDNMDTALSFYRDKLGFEVEDNGDFPRQVVLRSADKNKIILNRVRKLRKASPLDSQFSFTLQVNDLDQAIEKMKTMGVEFGEKERRKEGVGSAIYIKDPFGRLISLMHQTIVKVERFKEPGLYNYGFLIPDMTIGREFYVDKLGFVVRSEKYLPHDLPLGHKDKSFAFMLHVRPNVAAVQIDYAKEAPFSMLIFETENLEAAVHELKGKGVRFIDDRPKKSARGSYISFVDPFGNVSELFEPPPSVAR